MHTHTFMYQHRLHNTQLHTSIETYIRVTHSYSLKKMIFEVAGPAE